MCPRPLLGIGYSVVALTGLLDLGRWFLAREMDGDLVYLGQTQLVPHDGMAVFVLDLQIPVFGIGVGMKNDLDAGVIWEGVLLENIAPPNDPHRAA